MLAVIQESSPDSAMIHSWGCRFTSRTGSVVPTIWYSTFETSSCASRSVRDDLEAAVCHGQDLSTGLGDGDVVLDSDPAPARDVDAGLDGDHMARLQAHLGARLQVRSFVGVEPEAVPGSVDETVGQPRSQE